GGPGAAFRAHFFYHQERVPNCFDGTRIKPSGAYPYLDIWPCFGIPGSAGRPILVPLEFPSDLKVRFLCIITIGIVYRAKCPLCFKSWTRQHSNLVEPLQHLFDAIGTLPFALLLKRRK